MEHHEYRGHSYRVFQGAEQSQRADYKGRPLLDRKWYWDFHEPDEWPVEGYPWDTADEAKEDAEMLIDYEHHPGPLAWGGDV